MIARRSLLVAILIGPRRARRAAAIVLMLAMIILIWPFSLPAQHTLPTASEVEAFAELVRSERDQGTKVRVPDNIFDELAATLPDDYPPCHRGDRNILEAHEISPISKLAGILVIQGQGGCFCSPTGNCEFWIYEVRAAKHWVILHRGSIQTFVFLKSRTHGLPDLVTWSHGSATEHGARLFRFDGSRYVASGGWDEESEYLGGDGKIVTPAKPRVTSHFSSEEQLPKDVKP
jgi:hypothetical protein